MISVRYFFWPLSLSSHEEVCKLALDVDGAALLEVLAGDFGGALEGDEIVPLGLVLPIAFLVFVAIVGGEA